MDVISCPMFWNDKNVLLLSYITRSVMEECILKVTMCTTISVTLHLQQKKYECNIINGHSHRISICKVCMTQFFCLSLEAIICDSIYSYSCHVSGTWNNLQTLQDEWLDIILKCIILNFKNLFKFLGERSITRILKI